MIKEKNYFVLDNEPAVLVESYSNLAITKSGKIWNYAREEFCPTVFCRDTGYYETILFSENGTGNFARISILLASHFIPNPDNLGEVEPINGNRRDHNIHNLRWVLKDNSVEPSFFEKTL